MNRREFITLLVWPPAARAQQLERMRRIGVFMRLAADDEIRALRRLQREQGGIAIRVHE